jgi:hypothetical protein
LDHASAHAGIADLSEPLLASLLSTLTGRASKPRVSRDGPSIAPLSRQHLVHQHVGSFDTDTENAGQQEHHGVRSSLRRCLQSKQPRLLNFLDLITDETQTS